MTPAESPKRGYSATKDDLRKRLARIEGQVRGIDRMVEEDRYCIDVLTQISAVQAALDKVALGLLDDHTAHCVMGADAGSRDEKRRGADGRGWPAPATGLRTPAADRGSGPGASSCLLRQPTRR